MTVVVVGLGYVGLPLAVALAQQHECIGLDINKDRIAELAAGYDRTREVEAAELRATRLKLTSDPKDCHGADIYIVTVPTPVDGSNTPDLSPVFAATKTVGGLLKAGRNQIVVYESTVYPGVTEDICGPLLEQTSGLVCGKDFFLGYSPERANPGDREHTLATITKVVAGQNETVAETLVKLYGSVVGAGVFLAKNIKTAEAAKVIENAQRDINIAFVNEVTLIFQRLGLSGADVLEAAGTKWNFLPFKPGLVGGHCIGVDPYYLSYCAQQIGYKPDVILAGRKVNDGMGYFIADHVSALAGPKTRILVMGLTFKENVPDIRNSKVADIVLRLRAHGHDVTVTDPLANSNEAEQEFGIAVQRDLPSGSFDAVIGAVAHSDYASLDTVRLGALVLDGGIIADVKGMWRNLQLPATLRRWQL